MMAATTWDNHLRLRDLEAALCTLVEVLRPGRPELAADIDEAVRRLKSRGEQGAAALLEGEPARAAYRR
jgi:hypothetical protein